MSPPLKKLRDGTVRTSAGIERTVQHVIESHRAAGIDMPRRDAESFVKNALNRHDRKKGE